MLIWSMWGLPNNVSLVFSSSDEISLTLRAKNTAKAGLNSIFQRCHVAVLQSSVYFRSTDILYRRSLRVRVSLQRLSFRPHCRFTSDLTAIRAYKYSLNPGFCHSRFAGLAVGYSSCAVCCGERMASAQAAVESCGGFDVDEFYVQSFAAGGGREVPAQFVVGVEQMAMCYSSSGEQEGGGKWPEDEQLPLVDLSALENGEDSAKQEVKAKIDEACQEWGFFRVVNHGIDWEVVERARRAAREFFELPVEEKRKWARKEGRRDQVAGYGRTDGFRGNAADWMDSLYAFLAPPSLKAPNLWPSTPADYRYAIESFGEETHKLMKRLVGVISENLGTGLEKELAEFNVFYRANYYPPCPQPEVVLGTHSHTDEGAITVLVQDPLCDGLQVRKDSRWIPVPALPTALVINLGDRMKAMSKGKYKSAEHRGVVTNTTTAMTLVVHLDPPLSQSH